MIFRKNLKAGVLLYALLMSSIFVLILQVYLLRQVSTEKIVQAQLSSQKSYMMAEWTKDLAKDEKGTLSFDAGQASYERDGGQFLVKVTLKDGQKQSYRFTQDETRTVASTRPTSSETQTSPQTTQSYPQPPKMEKPQITEVSQVSTHSD
ncbi:competence type IV pilus minor pilin ComGG [Streptococcus caprae]|uniref:Competence type IV pilus minor pilin ComGG n=1 Tax=Streptococcus caprae TaxID=1640501 RepID=A0ABV8CW77_9STRE